MGMGFVIFKGDDTDMKNVENFIAQLKGNSDYDYLLLEFFNFDYTEKRLDFGGDIYGVFDTEAWANLLNKVFPKLAFFIVGDMTNLNDCCGVEWFIYKDGTCVDEKRYVYSLDEIYELDGDEIDDTYEVRQLIINCFEGLIETNILVWRLSDEDEKELQTAKIAVQEAQEKLEKTLSRFNDLN